MSWEQIYEESLKSTEHHQAAKDSHKILYGLSSALHGAVLSQNQDVFNGLIEAIFMLGFRAGREDAKLDVFREALDDEHF
jgi:hypothetical protein